MRLRWWPAMLVVLVLVGACSRFAAPQAGDWRGKTTADSAQMAVVGALRAVDPCGFVDADTITMQIPGAVSYGYDDSFSSCHIRLGAFSGGFSSDVSASIGFDLPAGLQDGEEEPTDSFQVDGITVTHTLGPTSNRGWCRYVFGLHPGDIPGTPLPGPAAALFGRARVVVLADLAKDPGPGAPVYPCREAAAVARGAAQIRSQRLPLRPGSAPALVRQDPCSVLADLRGFTRYIPQGMSGPNRDLYSCMFGSGQLNDPAGYRALLTLRPIDPREPDTPTYGDERHSAVEQRDGVELHVSTTTSKYEKPSCAVYVFMGKPLLPNYFGSKTPSPGDSRVPGIAVRDGSCDDEKTVAVAAAKRFAQ